MSIPINKDRKDNRRVESGRLVYYNKKATQGYWEDVWVKDLTPDFYRPFQSGNLFNFERIFIQHLPKTGRILEAGCGTAQLVVALNAKGYRCFGTDFAINTLRKAQELTGPLELFSSDLTAVGVMDGVFDAIISIGVVEHRREGPEPFLDEKQRIMRPGGVLLISVPYFNPLRQWRAGRGAYQGDVSGYEFYQYAYPREEFLNFLKKAGFEIEAIYTYSHQNTLTQELQWLNRIPGFLKKIILRVSKYVPYVNSELGHMLMVVARKKVL
jgi:SAM-dependent methyltransferase